MWIFNAAPLVDVHTLISWLGDGCFDLICILAVLVFLLYSSVNPSATDLWQSLQDYFNDSAIQFDYGSVSSSNNPRVELTIHYRSSGFYYSSG